MPPKVTAAKAASNRQKVSSYIGVGIITGGGVPAPYPPPSGFQWEYVFEGVDPVYENNERVVELIRIAA